MYNLDVPSRLMSINRSRHLLSRQATGKIVIVNLQERRTSNKKKVLFILVHFFFFVFNLYF